MTVLGKVAQPYTIRSKENGRSYPIHQTSFSAKRQRKPPARQPNDAILGRENRYMVLRLGLPERWRQRFAALLQPIAELAISTVVQFADYAKNPVPRLWKPRRPAHRYSLTPITGFYTANERSGEKNPVGLMGLS
jgi:hypothetical protein